MNPMNRIASIFVFLLATAVVVGNAQPQRIFVENLDFAPIPIGTKAIKQIEIKGITGVGEFIIKSAPSAPFKFEGSSKDLVVVNGSIQLKFSFSPTAQGDFQSELILERYPVLFPQNNEIRVRLRGAAFRVQRNELIDFEKVVIADTVSRRVFIRSALNDNFKWKVISAPVKPFTLLNTDGPSVVGTDSAAFNFRFAPHRKGVFFDTCLLVRTTLAGSTLDTISVFLKGEGVDLGFRDLVTFKTTITGDSITRPVGFVFRPNNSNYKYRVTHAPESPFNTGLVGGLPALINKDSALLVFTYEPLSPGEHSDSLVVSRFSVNNEVIDSIVLRLHGVALGMPPDDNVVFGPLTIGQSEQKSVNIQLPVAPLTKAFTYTVVNATTTPVKGILKSPLSLSKNTNIQIDLTCAPANIGSARQTIVLQRRMRDGRVIDSTVIVANTLVRPRAVILQTKFSADTTRMRISDTAVVDILAFTEDPVDEPFEISDVQCAIVYNPTVVVPLLASGQRTVIKNDTLAVVIGGEVASQIRFENSPTKIAQLKFVAVMGDADRTKLTITDCSVTVAGISGVKIEASEAVVVITNVWRYANGSVRLVNTLQSTLTLDVDPNPVSTSATLRVRNAPSQQGTLVIVDASGRVVADLTPQIRQGTQDFTLTSGATGATNLMPGTYVARLVVQGIDGQNLYSVARLFVVQ